MTELYQDGHRVRLGTRDYRWTEIVRDFLPIAVKIDGFNLNAVKFCTENFGPPLFRNVSEQEDYELAMQDEVFVYCAGGRWDFFDKTFRFKSIADATMFKLAGFTEKRS